MNVARCFAGVMLIKGILYVFAGVGDCGRSDINAFERHQMKPESTFELL